MDPEIETMYNQFMEELASNNTLYIKSIKGKYAYTFSN